MKKIFNKKIITILIILITLIGLATYSSIYYSKFPLPTVNKLKTDDITVVFNKHFNKENKILINKEPNYWWEVIGSESKEMKDFYKDLKKEVNIDFSNVKIKYNKEPILNNINKNINIDLLMNVKDYNKDWKYNDILNYKII